MFRETHLLGWSGNESQGMFPFRLLLHYWGLLSCPACTPAKREEQNESRIADSET